MHDDVCTYQMKFCEHCGKLFLRPDSSKAIYCLPCAPLISALNASYRPAGNAHLNRRDV